MKQITPAIMDTQTYWHTKETLAAMLFDCGALKFGTFTLKSGLQSPIYFDFRVLISYPQVLTTIAQQFAQIPATLGSDLLCGVPLAAIPLATATALQMNKPMIMPRPDKKDHGTKKMVEGNFKEGDSCCIIEDLITSGGSVLATAQMLHDAGLRVTDIVVILDREQGGRAKLQEKGYAVHSLFGLDELLSLLESTGRIDESDATNVRVYIAQNRI